jgi:hypothetical protein
MEQIVFPIPEICEYLTPETKSRVYTTTERDEQGSKVSDFFERTEDMFSEMKWQKKLRGITKCFHDRISFHTEYLFAANAMLFWLCSHMTLWKSISFNFAVLINVLVAAFYPFSPTIIGELQFTKTHSFLYFFAFDIQKSTPTSLDWCGQPCSCLLPLSSPFLVRSACGLS